MTAIDLAGPGDGPAPVLDLRDVAKEYPGSPPVRALDGVTLAVAPGELVAVVGPSGSGKSTLLHLAGALDRPSAGTVRVAGADVGRLDDAALSALRAWRIGFVFQQFHLLSALTVLDNVLVPVLPRRVEFDRKARARGLLEAVGLAERASALPSELSGGQQQRVAIARALINRPSLLLADEPTGNLDGATGREIIDLLLDLREEYGMTMLIATHDAEVAASCDRIIRLQDGRVIGDDAVGPATDVLDRLGGLRP
jgi:putative ABC transport system ATP-binding protein